jgi:hypothetical protein
MPYLSTRANHLRYDAERHGGESTTSYLTVRLPTPEQLSQLDHGNDKYTYRFKPAPPQVDEVIRMIKLVIRDLNRDNIGFACMNMRVYPTDGTSPFWPPNPANSFLTEKLYTFVSDVEFPPTT